MLLMSDDKSIKNFPTLCRFQFPSSSSRFAPLPVDNFFFYDFIIQQIDSATTGRQQKERTQTFSIRLAVNVTFGESFCCNIE